MLLIQCLLLLTLSIHIRIHFHSSFKYSKSSKTCRNAWWKRQVSCNLLLGGKLNNFSFVIGSGFFSLCTLHNSYTPTEVMLYLYYIIHLTYYGHLFLTQHVGLSFFIDLTVLICWNSFIPFPSIGYQSCLYIFFLL